MDVAELLKEMHDKKMIVGDLNSKNIYVLKDGSLIFDPNVMKKYLGKEKHEAPEFLSKYYDESMDVWSFGILILQLFTNEEIDVILRNRSKILSNMKNSDDYFIQGIFHVCYGCLKKENERISIQECLDRIKLRKRLNDKKYAKLRSNTIALLWEDEIEDLTIKGNS